MTPVARMDEIKAMSDVAIQGPGVCAGMGTANTLHAACEALGMSLPGSTPVQANSTRMWGFVEQAAKRTVERVKEIVRGIERGVRGIGDPRPELQALEHAVAGEPALGVVEPQNDRDQKRAAAQHEQGEIGDITA